MQRELLKKRISSSNNKKQEARFKERVYKIVQKIPSGNFLTYKQVAELAGHPKSWRAVGNVLNKNQNPKVPCHRVIRSDGKIGGFNKGVRNKIRLLNAEGLKIIREKINLPPHDNEN